MLSPPLPGQRQHGQPLPGQRQHSGQRVDEGQSVDVGQGRTLYCQDIGDWGWGSDF